MAHEIFKLEEETQYLTVDGKLFASLDEASAHEETLTLKKTESLREIAFAKNLESFGKRYSEKNPYFGIFAGILYRGSNGADVLRNLIMNTPGLTKQFLTEVDKNTCPCYSLKGALEGYSSRCCEKDSDGPIKEAPIEGPIEEEEGI